MYVAGQKEMNELDRYTIEQLGLPGAVLMENAGAKVTDEILSSMPNENPRILVLAGAGNNGGDGFVIARRLADVGVDVAVCLLAQPKKIKGDARIHFDVYLKRGLPLFHFNAGSFSDFQKELEKADLIVDAIFGTGINRPIKEPFREVILEINKHVGKKPIISVDIPSGINSDNGTAEGVAIQATKTVTFVFPKKGFFLNEGPQYVGEWTVTDISVPAAAVNDLGLSMPELITESLVKNLVPKRPKHGHKGTFGHALVIGGSRHYVGAPIFAAKAALNSGAGLVTMATPEGIYPLAVPQIPEALFLPLSEEAGHFSTKALDELKGRSARFDSIAVGPGMGRFSEGEEWIQALIESFDGQPVVLDADALYLIRNNLDILQRYKGAVILTPHPGEMASLLQKSVKEVEADRLVIVQQFAEEHQVYLLLKGHRSIIAAPDGKVFINPFGNDALGKGGSGDVLTGLIASFLAQGAAPLNSLIAACFLHARSGEEKAKSLSHYGVMPFDIIEGIKEQLLAF